VTAICSTPNWNIQIRRDELQALVQLYKALGADGSNDYLLNGLGCISAGNDGAD
jgi:hypothetical protein